LGLFGGVWIIALAPRIDNHRRLAYFPTHDSHLPMGDWLARASASSACTCSTTR
jgi:hypothetical protein